jgi:hypothetical protein
MDPHVGLGVVVAHAEWDDADAGQLREAVEHPEERVVERRTVVHPGADHDLAVDLDAVVEQEPEPPQAGGAPPVAQQPGPQVRIGGVDAHVEGAEPLVDDPLQIGLGETGQGCEVSVEK